MAAMRTVLGILALLFTTLGLMPAADLPTFTLTSTSWHEGKPIPKQSAFSGFGVGGGNISPDLAWSGAPATTQSYALTIYDPDAPTGAGFWHWVVFNIPGTATGLPAGAGEPTTKTAWTNGLTDYGVHGYGGPAPPPGDAPHHYIVTVYALSIPKLDLTPDTTNAMLKFMIRGHVVATASLTATFAR